MCPEIFSQFNGNKLSPSPPHPHPPDRDHVLEGRRSQGGLNPNSVQIDLFGAGNIK